MVLIFVSCLIMKIVSLLRNPVVWFVSIRIKQQMVKFEKRRRKKNSYSDSDSDSDSDNDNDNDNDDYGNNNSFHADMSLEDVLLDVGIPLSTLNHDAIGIVHRIDQGTSGCIVLAKNNDVHARLVTYFFTRSVNKSYVALVPFGTATTDSDNGNSNGNDTDNNHHGNLKELEPSGTISNDIGGRPTLSKYNIVTTYGTNAIQLKVETKTGCGHQVRVHCAKGLDRPIFLGPIYSSFNLGIVNSKNEKSKGKERVKTRTKR